MREIEYLGRAGTFLSTGMRSLYPNLFSIGNFDVTTFGLMMFLAFLAGAWVLSLQLKRYGLPKEIAWDILASVAIGGVLGAKIYYLLLHMGDVRANPWDTIFSRGGLVWYGGLIGGVLAYYYQVKSRKLPIATMFDGMAPSLCIAYAIGRLGCFLVGDDYGRYTTSSIGIAFPEGAPASTAGNLREIGEFVPLDILDSTVIKVIPTQLFEIAMALMMFAIIWPLGKKRSLMTGQLFAAWMALYSVERFIIEFYRAKGDRLAFGLSTSQYASIILMLMAGYLWWHQGRKAVPTPLTDASAAVPARTPVKAAR